MQRLVLTALAATAIALPAHADWQFFNANYGNSDEYYYVPIDKKGAKATVRNFSYTNVTAQAPVPNNKDLKKPVKLITYLAEQSTYDINCNDKTIQLTQRIFYEDSKGNIPILVHNLKDPYIQESNSEFAKQFIKTPLNYAHSKLRALWDLACP
jgi:hypothetical protein